MNGTAQRRSAVDAIDVLLDQIAAAIEEVRRLANEMEHPPDDRPDTT